MEPLTKQEAINLHRKMWNWIADETEKKKKKVEKYEYFKRMDIPYYERPYNACYCCEYAKQHENCGLCSSCPIDWRSKISCTQCIDRFEDGDEKGLYEQWSCSEDYQQCVELARTIANLPESKKAKDKIKTIFNKIKILIFNKK